MFPEAILTQITDWTTQSFLIALCVSLGVGLIVAASYMFRNVYTKGFAVTLVLMPMVVQVIICVVNGNLGTGVAVMGAFSLVRFRSAPGSAREITSIFLAMAVGLAVGVGYIALAVLMAVVFCAVSMALYLLPFGEIRREERDLKITIPESLDYTGAFDDLFQKYARRTELLGVRTTNMGSLYRLHYRVSLKNAAEEKAFMDDLRCRNGNLEISIGRPVNGHEEL